MEEEGEGAGWPHHVSGKLPRISIEIDSLKRPCGPGLEVELHLEVVHQMPHQNPPFKHNENEEQEPRCFYFLTKCKDA